MTEYLCGDSELKCMLGSSSAKLKVGSGKVQLKNKPMANIADGMPIKNIPSFGTCKITKCTCAPLTAMWMCSSKVKVRGLSAVESDAKIICALGGVIQADE